MEEGAREDNDKGKNMPYGKITYINRKEDYYPILENKGSYRWLKKIKPYVILSILLLAVFMIVNTDFESLKYSIKSRFSSDSVRKMDVPKEWMEKYNIVLTNKMSVLDDGDADNLTFKEEALYGTNPFISDTDGDGINDGGEIKEGNNPLGNGDLDNDHDGIPDKWEEQFSLSTESEDNNQDNDGDGLKNIDEYLHGTNPLEIDTDRDGYGDSQEIKNGYDPDAPGNPQTKVVILSDKIGLVAPMVWSKSEDPGSFEDDLEKGVAHYPESGIPGQNGNIIIAGHSSNYAWAKGDYNSIFKNIDKLSPGEAFVIRVIQQNGKTFDYEYKITEKRILNPSDEWIFQSFDNDQILTLSTCWPIGTDISRLVIRAKREPVL